MSEGSVFKARAPRTLKLQKPAPRKLPTQNSETKKVMDSFLQNKMVLNGCPESTVGNIHTEMQTDPRGTVTNVEVTGKRKEESHISEQLTEVNSNGITRKAIRTAKLTKPRPLRQNMVAASDVESDLLADDEIEKQTATFIQRLPAGSMSLAEIVAFRNMLIKNKVVLQNVGYDIFSICYGIIQEVLKEEDNPKKRELLWELLSLRKLDEPQKSLLMENKERHRKSSVEYQRYCDLNSMAVLHDLSREINNNEPDFCEPCQQQRQKSGRSRHSSVSSDQMQTTDMTFDMNQNLHSTASSVRREIKKNECHSREDFSGKTSNTNEPEIGQVDSNENNVISRMHGSSQTLLQVIHQRDLHINDVIVDPRSSARKNNVVLRSISQNSDYGELEQTHREKDIKKNIMPSFSSQESRDSGIGDEAVLWDTDRIVLDDLKEAAVNAGEDPGIEDDEVLWEDEDTVLEDLKKTVSKDTCIKLNVDGSTKAALTFSESENIMTTDTKLQSSRNSWATWNQPQENKENLADSGAWTRWRSRKDSFESHESLDTPTFSSRRNSLDSCDSLNDFTKCKTGNNVVKGMWNNVNKNVQCGNGNQSDHGVLRRASFDSDASKKDCMASKSSDASNNNESDMQKETENFVSSLQLAQLSKSKKDNDFEVKDISGSDTNRQPLVTFRGPIGGFGTPAQPNIKKPFPSKKYQSADSVKNWRESCTTKPKFLTRLTDLEISKLCNEVIRQPIGPGTPASVVAKVEASLPNGMFTAKGRRQMFWKFQKYVLGDDTDLWDNNPPPSYTREELIAFADSPLSKIIPEEFSYLSKIFPEVCLVEPDYVLV